MEPYEPTLSETMTKLRKEGYTEDFSMKPQFLECHDGELLIFPSEFNVDKVFRFEGLTNPDDEAILYAISSKKNNMKGVMVEAYGVYTDSVSNEMMMKLRAH